MIRDTRQIEHSNYGSKTQHPGEGCAEVSSFIPVQGLSEAETFLWLNRADRIPTGRFVAGE
jgi:hypothetical protein